MPRPCGAWLTEVQAVVHITPQVPPAICGVGDYAAVVGRRMEELCAEVRCGYLAAGHRAADAGAMRDVAEFWGAVEEVAAVCSMANGEHIEGRPHPGPLPAGERAGTAIVLHYSGYGYDPNGAPVWLAEALERRPAHLAGVRVVTFFHELYATGMPWQRAFWASGRQRAAAVRVARASDALATNREQSARWLERQAGLPAGSVSHLPVCSNVGEPAELIPWGERANRAVTFGGARFKAAFLTGAGVEKTVTLCQRLGLNELVDLGENCRCHEERFASAGIAYRQLGYLPAAEVMGYMSDARIALIDYFPGYLAKSGVLAAAAAAGAAPIIWSRSEDSDGLEFGRNLLTIDSVVECDAAGDVELSNVSAAIADWYREHSSDRHAQLQLRLCGATTAGTCVRQ